MSNACKHVYYKIHKTITYVTTKIFFAVVYVQYDYNEYYLKKLFIKLLRTLK